MATFVVLGAATTYPLILNIGRAVPGGGDAWIYYWDLWWIKRAAVDLHTNPFFTHDLYYPYGTSLYFHTLNLLPSVLALPVTLAFGLTAAYNTLVLLSFALSGYGMYRLVLYVLAHDVDGPGVAARPHLARLAAFVAGLVFASSTYRVVHAMGHLDLGSTYWLPLFALYLLKTRDEPGWTNPVLAAIFLAATAATALYHLVYLLLFAALMVIRVSTARRRDWPAMARVASVAIIFLLLALPILPPILRLGGAAGRVADPAFDVDRFSGDALSFVIPSPMHPLFGRFVASWHQRMARHDSGIEGILFLGYVPLVLAAIGVMRYRAMRRFWLVALVLFTLLALGPVAHVGGRPIAASLSPLMPYYWLARLPYGDIPRVPARFVVMTTVSLAVIAGAGTWSVLTIRRATTATSIAIVLAALIVFETIVLPLPLAVVTVPPYAETLGHAPARAGVLDVPIPDDPASYRKLMLYQTVHGKPMYGGYLARGVPPLPFDGMPGFAQLKTLLERVDDVVSYDSARLPAISRAVLDAYGVGYVVIHKTDMRDEDVQRVRRITTAVLGASASAFEDESTLVFAAAAPAAPPPAPAVWLDTGWSYLERLDRRDATGRTLRWRWMGDRARLGVIAPEPRDVRLRLTMRAYGRVRRLGISINGTELPALKVSADRDEFETASFRAPAGVTFVEVRSLDGAESPGDDPRRLSVAVFRLDLL